MAAERRRTVKVRSEREKKRIRRYFFMFVAGTRGGFRNFLIDNVEDTTNGLAVGLRMILVWLKNSKC